jgi:hypothetical protein
MKWTQRPSAGFAITKPQKRPPPPRQHPSCCAAHTDTRIGPCHRSIRPRRILRGPRRAHPVEKTRNNNANHRQFHPTTVLLLPPRRRRRRRRRRQRCWAWRRHPALVLRTKPCCTKSDSNAWRQRRAWDESNAASRRVRRPRRRRPGRL